jgi:hypothetical protein
MNKCLKSGVVRLDELTGPSAGLGIGHPRDAAIGAKPGPGGTGQAWRVKSRGNCHAGTRTASAVQWAHADGVICRGGHDPGRVRRRVWVRVSSGGWAADQMLDPVYC